MQDGKELKLGAKGGEVNKECRARHMQHLKQNGTHEGIRRQSDQHTHTHTIPHKSSKSSHQHSYRQTNHLNENTKHMRVQAITMYM
jgi:hypothetical protein